MERQGAKDRHRQNTISRKPNGSLLNVQLAFNGKFLSAAPTGVHRVAAELIIALDRLMQSDPELARKIDATVLTPRNADRSLDLSHIRIEKVGRLTGQLWEQLELPFLTKQRLLVSLCNLGPVATRNAVTMIHDAQVHLTPASYSPAFRLFYRTAQPLMGRRHHRILTVSDFSRQQLDRLGVAPAHKTNTIHNGVDHVMSVTAKPGASAAFGVQYRKFALALANTQPHKNISILLRAFAAPPLSDMQLVLFGKADRGEFEELYGPVPANVMFTGPVSDDVLVGLMKEALCLAFPSTTEGFGLPPLEAMQVGCPALVAPCGALPEVCGDAVDYVSHEQPAAWRDAIIDLAQNPDKWSSLSERGKAHAAAFTWERAARQLISVLDEVVAAN